MLESLQFPVLVAALTVLSWAVIRLGSQSRSQRSSHDVPPEVLRWQAELTSLAQSLQAELDEKMAAVCALSEAYERASQRLSDLIALAEQVERDSRLRMSKRLSA